MKDRSWWWMRMMANLGHFHKFWNLAFVLPFKFRKKWLLLFLTVWSIATQFRLKFSDSITKINFPHRFVDTDFLARSIQATAPQYKNIIELTFCRRFGQTFTPQHFLRPFLGIDLGSERGRKSTMVAFEANCTIMQFLWKILTTTTMEGTVRSFIFCTSLW